MQEFCLLLFFSAQRLGFDFFKLASKVAWQEIQVAAFPVSSLTRNGQIFSETLDLHHTAQQKDPKSCIALQSGAPEY